MSLEWKQVCKNMYADARTNVSRRCIYIYVCMYTITTRVLFLCIIILYYIIFILFNINFYFILILIHRVCVQFGLDRLQRVVRKRKLRVVMTMCQPCADKGNDNVKASRNRERGEGNEQQQQQQQQFVFQFSLVQFRQYSICSKDNIQL